MRNDDGLQEVKDRIDSYDKRILEAETELQGLKKNRDQLVASLKFIQSELADPEIKPATQHGVKRSEVSIRDKIVETLQRCDENGLETAALKAAIENAWPGETIKISSLRTNLSVLRGDEKIVTREHKKWRLVEPETP